MKKYFILITLIYLTSLNFSIFGLPFNSKLSESDINSLNAGNILVKNINHSRNISLENSNELAIKLKSSIKNLSPKYLAEIIKIKPYEGNEDLPEKLEKLLLNVNDYAGIPLWSVKWDCYFDLYSNVEITDFKQEENITNITAQLEMMPFGKIEQNINIQKTDETILYFSENTKPIHYREKMECIGKKKMNMSILLFRDNENWILYGIGGVNAPQIPFLNERIETSFINRITTFCNFIFTEIEK